MEVKRTIKHGAERLRYPAPHFKGGASVVASPGLWRSQRGSHKEEESNLNQFGLFSDPVHFSNDHLLLINEFLSGDPEQVAEDFSRIRERQKPNVSQVTDRWGLDLLRTSNPSEAGGYQNGDELLCTIPF